MKQNIIVTGTNSGFGNLIVKTLAQKGHNVFATMRDIRGRNQDPASSLKNIAETENQSIQVIEMEMNSDDSVNEGVQKIVSEAGSIDTVVNNAGYGVVGLQEGLSSGQLLELFNVNVVGPHRLVRAVLPSMRERHSGLLITISSGLARMTLPLLAAYCASKSALEALFDGYRYELKPTGVESVLLQPGVFPTNFAGRHLVGENHKQVAKGYGPLEKALEHMFEGLEISMSSPDAPNPQMVADAVLELVESPAGQRPDRVVVDPLSGVITETLNKAHADMQQQVLRQGGMADLI